jgi:transcriptional regulator with XRE-family HTH domain
MTSDKEQTQAEVLVGRKLRQLRNQKSLSLRALAERSGLNFNTLSLVENGKSSPSVGTLQQLAVALEVPISTFFESESIRKRVVFTPEAQRPQASFGSMVIQNLGKDLARNVVQPFVVTLNPGTGSSDHDIVHTGHEFVYCLSGSIDYRIEQSNYDLKRGDSLLFESHLPHRWENKGESIAQFLLILYPADEHEDIGGRHFTTKTSEEI